MDFIWDIVKWFAELFVPQGSTYAHQIDGIILLIALIVGFWGALAMGVFFYFILKFRKKDGRPAQYITGEKKEEMKWIHLPHNAILVFDVSIIVFAVWVWYGVKQDLPKADETVRVVGQQWAWKFVHPGLDGQLGTDDDVATVDELHVKVNTLYHYKLESVDVMHNFSVPIWRLKQDAVPGRVITGWFEPTKTGQFDIQCAEMCGIGHGIMGAKLFVETEEEHRKWLESQMTLLGGN